ncbi:hypothetical protein OEZ85_000212 [Tetradesmus obliquus]|uniref:EGF-like domain-containing protein n=1 Tax=Tetradesmus obliquus TaxID=3088 RepID=A0ABY8UT09_TETOB|nr:hypothetical protein OEZ85_000212 [Tetradesmus obliquus]
MAIAATVGHRWAIAANIRHKSSKGSYDKQCPAGCEVHGNCNRALGRCECAIGYSGPDCATPLWPACKLHPNATEMFCGEWYPKSCECLRQCYSHICPKGPQSCERLYDLTNAKCFERQPGFEEVLDGAKWDGGSLLPDAAEAGVKYYHKAPQKSDGKSFGVVREIEREEFVKLQGPAGSKGGPTALHPNHCPGNCSYRGACMQDDKEQQPYCLCHYGFTGERCEHVGANPGHQHACWNNCQGRGVCRRGFCHCQKGWWGKDCGRSRAFGAHSARRAVHKLRVYAYDLPWELAYQPEYHVGWRDHDQIYMAWQVFGELFFNDSSAVRTDNPYEANMFYIPAMTYVYSSNLGDTLVHSKRVIDYVRTTWPFFNRTKGLDHFMWLTNDQGACHWPGSTHPEMANVIKVVHYAWHNPFGKSIPTGWNRLPNKHWGCFHPLRDISAAPYWLNQAGVAAAAHGLQGAKPTFDVKAIPAERLLFFAGGIRHGDPSYSHGVRQELHTRFGRGQHPNITIHEGRCENYSAALQGSKYCLAPSGHGWGIRLSQYMIQGCVPVIIQDDIYQAWEDLLPYADFSVRLPMSRIAALPELLASIPDADYLQLRAGVAKYWRAFVWDRAAGGMAYDFMMASLQNRMLRLQARQFHPLQQQQQQPAGYGVAEQRGL